MLSASNDKWCEVAFGEMAEHVAERVEPTPQDGERYVGLEHLDSGSLTVRRWGAEVALIGTKLRMRKGDILFARRNAYLRRIAIAPHDGLFSAHGMVLRARPDVILPAFLPFFMQSDVFMDRAERISVGSLSPTINWTTLKDQRFVIPPPREQRRMADALTAIRGAQESHIQASSALSVVFDSLVARLLSQVRGPADSFLSEHADIRYGLTVDPKRRKYPNKVPYLRVANVIRGRLDLTEIKTVGTIRGDDIYRLSAGDVLIVEGHASVEQIGRAAVWRSEHPEMFHQNHLIRARCGDSIDAEYLCLLVNSQYGQAYFRSRAKSTSGLNTINSTVVKQFRIPVPARNVQLDVVQKATEGRHLAAGIAHRQNSFAELRRAVLDSLKDSNP